MLVLLLVVLVIYLWASVAGIYVGIVTDPLILLAIVLISAHLFLRVDE